MTDLKTALLLLIIFYLLLVNLAAFTMFGLDKHFARKNKRRIPEMTLFTISFTGGSLGALIGIWVFRHKTKHPSFTIGIPAILIGETALLALYFILVL